MRSFAKFLKESFAFEGSSNNPFSLPNIKGNVSVGVVPVGGYRSYSDKMDAIINKKHQESDYSELWNLAEALERIKKLAEDAHSAIELRKTGNYTNENVHLKNYKEVQYDNTEEKFYNFPQNEIIGGKYARLHFKDLEKGINLQIFRNVGSGKYELYVKNLRENMISLQEKLQHFLEKEKYWKFYAQNLDDQANAAKAQIGKVVGNIMEPSKYNFKVGAQ